MPCLTNIYVWQTHFLITSFFFVLTPPCKHFPIRIYFTQILDNILRRYFKYYEGTNEARQYRTSKLVMMTYYSIWLVSRRKSFLVLLSHAMDDSTAHGQARGRWPFGYILIMYEGMSFFLNPGAYLSTKSSPAHPSSHMHFGNINQGDVIFVKLRILKLSTTWKIKQAYADIN